MRKFLYLLLFLLAPALGSAQTHYAANIALGAHGGIDLSRVFFTPNVRQGWPVYPMLGVQFRYVEENHFGLIAELNYVRRGWKENFEGLPFSYQRNLDYLEIPIYAHIYFGRRAKFFLNAGPQIGFKIGENYSANFNPYDMANIPNFPNINRRNDQMTEKITQKVDYGISTGIGCEYNINPKNAVTLEARYYFGLGNLFPSKRQDIFRASNTMYIAILAGYWFRIK